MLALTAGHDVYAWGGGHPGQRSPLLAGGGASFVPTPVVVVVAAPGSGQQQQQEEEVEDVLDCAVGDAHAVVLAGDGRVYVAGDNGNGQLGLPGDKAKAKADAKAGTVVSWTKVDLPPGAGDVVAVAAGPRSSFIVARHSY